MSDRYTKIVLTIIAIALVYLCIVVTPFTTVSAQTALRPGDPTGPGQVVIVGWHTSDVAPVAFQQPVRITATEPLRVTGSVATERSTGAADRVVGSRRLLLLQRPGARAASLANGRRDGQGHAAGRSGVPLVHPLVGPLGWSRDRALALPGR